MIGEEDETEPIADEGLMTELRWIHGIIRENLTAIIALTDHIRGGTAPAAIQAQLQDLAATNIVWTLRSGCVRWCALVHAHHHGEDAHFFPGLRRINPALRPVIDRLEADHVVIATHLDTVDAAARRIATDEAARAALATALQALADHLLTHLAYEEDNLAPTLRRLTTWPFG